MSQPCPVGTQGSAQGSEVSTADLTEARVRLLLHRLDPASEGCAACGRPSPCATSQDAAEVLARAGAWNTLDVPTRFAPPSDLLAGSPHPLDDPAAPAPASRGSAVGRVRLLLARLGVPRKPRRGYAER